MAELFEYPSKDLERWNGCQRNWDYSRPVEPEHVQRFIDMALSAPSKNNLNLLEIQVFENSLETQKAITENAKGSPKDSIKTSTEAPLTFFFGYRKGQKQFIREESPVDFLDLFARHNGVNENFYKECMRHADMAAALIAGALSIKAIELGYKTGMNACFMPGSKLYNSDSNVFLSIGIGHPFYEDHTWRKYSNNTSPTKGTKEELQGPFRPKYKTKLTHIKNNTATVI